MTRRARGRRGLTAPVTVGLVLIVAGAAVVGALFVTGTLSFPGVGGHSSPRSYKLTFNETGLPAETGWSVNLDNSIVISVSTTIIYERVDGTYPFRVSGPSTCSNWKPDPASGKAVVAGADQVVDVEFSGSSCSVSYSISMGSPSWSGSTTDYGTIEITAVSEGLETSLFGFAVTTVSGSPVPVAVSAPTSTCKAGVTFSTTACTAPTEGNWYVVLYYTGNGSIANVWVNGAWTTGLATNYSVPIGAGTEGLMIIAPSSVELPGSGDTLEVYGTSSDSVSGASGSF